MTDESSRVTLLSHRLSALGLLDSNLRAGSFRLTRNVVDAMYMVREIVQHSEHHSPDVMLKFSKDITAACRSLDLTGVRIGIPWHLKEIKKLHGAKFEPFKRVLDGLKSADATLVHDVIVTERGCMKPCRLQRSPSS